MWSKRRLCSISIHYNILRLVLWSVLGSGLYVPEDNVLGGVLWLCQLCQKSWWDGLSLSHCCWLSLPFLSIPEKRIFKFPTIVVDLSISPFTYFSLCLYHIVYFEALLIGACTFRVEISFCWIYSFNIIRCLSLSLVIVLVLELIFDVVTLVLFWSVFAWSIFFPILYF